MSIVRLTIDNMYFINSAERSAHPWKNGEIIFITPRWGFSFVTAANEVWGKVMFLHLCVILFTGEEGVCPTPHRQTLLGIPPNADSPGLGRPLDRPPRVGQTLQVGQTPLDADPLGLGRTLQVRQTPQMQFRPGLERLPWMQTPLGWAHPLDADPPQDWADPLDAVPPGLGRPPRCRAPWVGQTLVGLGRTPPQMQTTPRLDRSPRIGQTLWMQFPQGWADPPDAEPPGLGRPSWGWAEPPRCRPLPG